MHCDTAAPAMTKWVAVHGLPDTRSFDVAEGEQYSCCGYTNGQHATVRQHGTSGQQVIRHHGHSIIAMVSAWCIIVSQHSSIRGTAPMLSLFRFLFFERL